MIIPFFSLLKSAPVIAMFVSTFLVDTWTTTASSLVSIHSESLQMARLSRQDYELYLRGTVSRKENDIFRYEFPVERWTSTCELNSMQTSDAFSLSTIKGLLNSIEPAYKPSFCDAYSLSTIPELFVHVKKRDLPSNHLTQARSSSVITYVFKSSRDYIRFVRKSYGQHADCLKSHLTSLVNCSKTAYDRAPHYTRVLRLSFDQYAARLKDGFARYANNLRIEYDRAPIRLQAVNDKLRIWYENYDVYLYLLLPFACLGGTLYDRRSDRRKINSLIKAAARCDMECEQLLIETERSKDEVADKTLEIGRARLLGKLKHRNEQLLQEVEGLEWTIDSFMQWKADFERRESQRQQGHDQAGNVVELPDAGQQVGNA